MAFWNSNTIHNILNGAGVIVGGLTTAAVATGCRVVVETGPLADGLDCSASFIPPAYAAPVLLGIGALKFIMNIARDGLGGLIKTQPPVSDGIRTVVVPVEKVEPGTKVDIKAVATASPTKKN